MVLKGRAWVPGLLSEPMLVSTQKEAVSSDSLTVACAAAKRARQSTSRHRRSARGLDMGVLNSPWPEQCLSLQAFIFGDARTERELDEWAIPALSAGTAAGTAYRTRNTALG